MRYFVAENGDGGDSVDWVYAEDPNEAARLAASEFYEICGRAPPKGVYDLSVMAPDGTLTRHAVLVEWEPTFRAHQAAGQVPEGTAAKLRARAAEKGTP